MAITCVSAMAQTAADATKPPALDQKPLALDQQIAALVSQPAVARAHWGVIVTTLDGKPIHALNEAQLFQPDSNAKLFTTAAAMALLGPHQRFTTRIEYGSVGSKDMTIYGDIVIIGTGDGNLSSNDFPYHTPGETKNAPEAEIPPLHYLIEVADEIAAAGVKRLKGDVIGDDTVFPWEPYPQGWSIDDMVWGYGAPVSALSINDNQLKVTVTSGPDRNHHTPTVAIAPAMPYYTLDTSKLHTSGAITNQVYIDRVPGSKILQVSGWIAFDSPDVEEIAIADPAEYAATALKSMLEARGVEVRGKALARHWIANSHAFAQEANQTAWLFPIYPRPGGLYCSNCGRPQLNAGETVIATHRSASLLDDVMVTNKVSQNLHAEILLRDLGEWLTTMGSTEEGVRVVREFLERAGIDPNDFVFYDGSGLSSYDLVTPRAIAKLLSYAAHDPKTGQPQPWFAAWKDSLPIGGVDGTLADRFTKASLKGHVFAKTGTHSEGRALSGYLDCASGQTVIFSILVENHLPGDTADRDAMDKIVAAIAAAE